MCSARGYVRFTPNSDRKSGHPQNPMSALPSKADMCSAGSDVCFGPIADMPPERDLISWSILSAVAGYPNHPRLCFTCSSFFLAGVRTNCMIEVARENAGYTPFAA
jgi:hypothetical protein